jgi:hypothetical protein
MNGQRPRLASRPDSDGFAGRFIHDIAAAAATGQHTAAARPPAPRRRITVALRPPPHTVQLCSHCRHRPAGIWVSATGGPPARRPWCLSCGQQLGPASYHLDPFDSHHGTTRHP